MSRFQVVSPASFSYVCSAASPRRRAPGARRPGTAASGGFGLVEMLIALALGALLLAGAWSWVWAVTSAGARAADQIEARSSLAFARRLLLADLRVATGLAPAPPSSATSLALAVPAWHQAEGLVTVHWDHSRAVLWRQTSSCHLAEGVDRFRLSYLDAQGDEIACGSDPLTPEAAASVRGIVVDLSVRVGDDVAAGRWPVWFGGGRR